MHRQLWAPSVALALLTTALVAPVLADDAELFTLESDTVAGGDSIKINFKGPLDPANQKYWVCVVEKGKADSTFGTWAYVTDLSGKPVTLKAPEVDGDYEVRLHGNYPDKSNNVLQRAALKISGLQPTAPDQVGIAAAESSPVDQKVTVTFPQALVPQQGVKFWVALVPADAPDKTQGLWRFVPIGATKLELQAPTASGKHEVRLHSNYPKQSTNVVARAAFEVTGAPDTAPTQWGSVELSLAAASVKFPAQATLKFNVPLRPLTGKSCWASLADAALPAASQGLRASIKPGATSVQLPAPTAVGKHRVRLYVSGQSEPVGEVALEVTGPDEAKPTQLEGIALKAPASVKVGAAPKVEFPRLNARTGERFWLTLIKKGEEDTAWGTYKYIPHAATSLELAKAKETGDFEIRLHANHPTKSSNVIARVPIKVE
ncbi:MAG TPA: hypothetical protein DEA08_22385 [Planctomycetes bacterium]|nr:hypothetical protein [Planctomycetota bacterium]